MLNISVNIETGIAKLSLAATIKAGGAVPVTVTFTSNPGTNPVIEFALSPDSSSPSVLAYLDAFAPESETVYRGTLDASDTRLVGYLTGKQAQTLNCELVVTPSGEQRVPYPNFPVTAQQPIITGPDSSEGGPTYLTDTLGDARYIMLGGEYGSARISANGFEIKDSVTNVWRRIGFTNGEFTYTEL